jgi:putative nucleotidyltransferase with HDIG domain
MNTELTINPFHFIKALSMALELSTTGISKHHLGTAVISKAFGEALHFEQGELQLLVCSALLHDIGAASDWQEKHFIIHNDEAYHIFDHAENGFKILSKFALFEPMAHIVRHHHDRYLGGNPTGVQEEDIPLESRILHLADRIDVLIDHETNIMLQKEKITYEILSSDYFDPKLIEIFEMLSLKESFWLNIVSEDHTYLFENSTNLFGKVALNMDDLISIATIFASVVDASSQYTYNHSFNVAYVAQSLALAHAMNDHDAKKFFLAGLLHDIGKLAVPNTILDKQSKLTEEEFLIMKQHPYYSGLILSKVEGFEEMANWIGHHHEYDDGFGYPDRLFKEDINLGIRILQIADIFCALAEKRPYRESMSPQAITDQLNLMVRQKKLDEMAVGLITARIDLFMDLVNKDV